MGITQTDAIVRQMVNLSIQDMKANPWLVKYILSDFTDNQYLSQQYGKKQVDSALEWFKNSEIGVYLSPINDQIKFPAITITPGPANEKSDYKTMGDSSTEKVVLMPNEIGKPINYVVKPFNIVNYDLLYGTITIDPTTTDLTSVSAGMILVDPSTGKGLVIIDITGDQIFVEPGLVFTATTVGIVPQYQFYEARVEHTWFQETIEIGCHSHGDPQVVLWLHSIALTALLRYRESMLEANGFSESIVSSSPLTENSFFSGPDGEQAFTRVISLTGVTENTWIKTPRRFVESLTLTSKNTNGYEGGIKILSNSEPSIISETDNSWYAINSNGIDTDQD